MKKFLLFLLFLGLMSFPAMAQDSDHKKKDDHKKGHVKKGAPGGIQFGPDMSKKDLKKYIKQAKIGYLRGLWQQYAKQIKNRPRLKQKFFKHFDKNQNGKLDKKEFGRVLQMLQHRYKEHFKMIEKMIRKYRENWKKHFVAWVKKRHKKMRKKKDHKKKDDHKKDDHKKGKGGGSLGF